VILVIALWPIPVVRWLVLSLNTAMLVSTPIDGSHYLIDIVAGIAIAVASFALAEVMVRWTGREAKLGADRPQFAR
jgi:hypothetical protein